MTRLEDHENVTVVQVQGVHQKRPNPFRTVPGWRCGQRALSQLPELKCRLTPRCSLSSGQRKTLRHGRSLESVLTSTARVDSTTPSHGQGPRLQEGTCPNTIWIPIVVVCLSVVAIGATATVFAVLADTNSMLVQG